ncbi:G2/M phase-specific E3 ubiquitin-protein ligase-like isoform X2 [Cyprinodon tularosa]|uniref:G2/M phase-specific E3 ubiquitin-protein ligase-like isoform X2 n=1 Tax=Cyprinodon tularosa TaxID=77115 RepID=UPI0018E1F484|nr:G2/M phase-specific E3 ubiquitin-protein ligase-like isoform X2 [Cyprinodon tularosa]
MGCGNKLISPKLQDGQQLNGQLIQKVFRSKALYVKPSQTLLEDPELRNATSYEVSPRTTRAMTRNKQLNTPENALPYNTDMGNFGEELPEIDHSTFCPSDNSHSNMPPSATTETQSATTISTSSSATDSNPSLEICQDEPTPHASSNYTTYLSVMSSVSDLSSDDEEMNHAILASIETHLSETSSKSLPVKDILEELSKNIDTGMHCKFNINRSAVLDGAIRGFKRISYNPHYSMNVKFSDDFGKNEEAIDLGGPRREFLRLLIEALSMSPMFEGPEECKHLAMNSTALREDRYFMAGRAIAVSLVHGGPAPRFLSPVLFAGLVGGPNAVCPTLKDITDADLQEKLKTVSESSTLEELLRATDPLLDYMTSAGCVRPLRAINDRDLLLHDLLMFHVVHRVQGPFQRFAEGLKTLGVLDAVKQHPNSFRSLFCHEPQQLTADMMDDLFTLRLASKGSNRRRVEETVIPLWRDYLQDAEGQVLP